MTISSSKYKDIISKSIRIHAGPPAVYQLKPKKETFGTLIRMTVGEKNPNKPNKTILLVGETGAGKSTLINALFNYTMGVKWEDKVWFQIIEEKKESQSESQTSDVIVYEIFGFEDETLTIIDTPGYGDTKGIERDLTIQQRLFDLFRSEDGVHEIHVVGLVVKASDNRVSDRLRYIFDSVMSLFGKNMENNIICLFTHSNGRKPKNAIAALEASKVKCARNKGNQPVYFLFDNCQHEDRTEEEEDCEYSDVISEKGMRAFTVFLKETEQQKLEITLEVLNERVRLTACIQNLQERIKLTELKQKEKKQIREVIEKYEDEEVKKQTSTVEIDEVYKDKENITGGMWGLFFYEGAVCCIVCEETCHYPGCTIAWKPEHCEVMKKGHCTVCTNKCPASKHVKEKWRYVIKTNKIKMTEADIKKKYESSQHLRNEIKQLTKEKSKLLDESYQHVIRLEEIALNVNSLSTFVHLDFLIEKMKEKEDKEKVQKLEKIKGRIDKETIAPLQDILRNLREQGKSMA